MTVIDERAGDIEPIEPGIPAILEKLAWMSAYDAAWTGILYYGYKLGPLSFLLDADGSLSWTAGVLIVAISLSSFKIGKWATAYRRYSLDPYSYKLAKKRANGEAITLDELEEKRTRWQKERVEEIEARLNELSGELEELSDVDATVSFSGGEYTVSVAEKEREQE